MITETPQTVLIGLLVVTLLGAVMGYVIASIRAAKRTETVVESMRAEMSRVRADAKAEKMMLSNETEDYQASLSAANERVTSSIKNEESLELHTQFLSQRIQSLESQVSSYEEQQIRLQRDFATYKSNKARELELARIKPESWSQAGDLPVLNKRIPQDESLMSRSFPATQVPRAERQTTHSSTSRSRARSHTKLSLPLSQELDIPTLAESELPDSVEELEFELADFDSDGGNSRG